ncbi:MAG: glycosyltransferase [Merdibacter sp.]
MKNTLISLIVPVYAVESMWCACSLIAQTGTDRDIIVSDGSQDGSDLICQRHAERYPQIRYSARESRQSAARNFGRGKQGKMLHVGEQR